MFKPRRFTPKPKQKQRKLRFNSTAIYFTNWPGLVACGSGLLAASVVNRLAILSKRASGIGISGKRFWINIQISGVVSQKPEKVRMGKGKGSYKGLIARVNRGTLLVMFSAIRHGMLHKLARWVQVRSNFLVRATNGIKNLPLQPTVGLYGWVDWRTSKNSNKAYISTRLSEFQEQLKRLRRPFLWDYFGKIFFWRLVTPVAVWTLPKSLKKRRYRVRLNRLKRQKIDRLLSSKSFSFVRQLKFNYNYSWNSYIYSKQPHWKRRQLVWSEVVQEGILVSPLAETSWNVLLKMPARLALLPSLIWLALLNPTLIGSRTTDLTSNLNSAFLSYWNRTNFRTNLRRQLVACSLYFYWTICLTHPVTKILARLLL